MFDPIVILGTPRSFTSLTAGIFRDHDVWFGKDKQSEYAPTGSCENARMKRILKCHASGVVWAGEVCEPFPEFKKKMEEVMRDEEGDMKKPWGAKHSAMYYPVWDGFSPKFICCRRNPESIMKSGDRVGFSSTNEHSVIKHIEVMDMLVDSGRAVNVYGEKYFQDDFSDLEKAFEYSGLDFDSKIAETLIDERHKHF